MTKRLPPDERKEEIFQAAIHCALQAGFMGMTRELVATEAECSPALISHYFGDFRGLCDEVMLEAVARPILPIVAQGLVVKHPLALDAPEVTRREAAASLVLP